MRADYSILDELAADQWPPSRALSREVIVDAINAAAQSHDQYVTAAWVRPLLPGWCVGPQVGAIMSGLVRSGRLVRVEGAVHESGNAAQRNAHRLMPLYRLPTPITVDDLTTGRSSQRRPPTPHH